MNKVELKEQIQQDLLTYLDGQPQEVLTEVCNIIVRNFNRSEMKMNKLEQFQQMLQQHDWAYVMSDDHSRFMAGVASTEKLRAFAIEIDCEASRSMWSVYAYVPSFMKGRVPKAYPEGKK
tara:strand:- start:14 stop:373 length:360 start_codon:yes stop_codon:yes gene_type:complete